MLVRGDISFLSVSDKKNWQSLSTVERLHPMIERFACALFSISFVLWVGGLSMMVYGVAEYDSTLVVVGFFCLIAATSGCCVSAYYGSRDADQSSSV